MRALFTLLMLILCCSRASAQDAERPIRDKWALVVGISNFQNQQLNLHYAAKDANDFYRYLTSDGRFAKDHVRLLLNENATRENILSEVGDSWLPRVAQPDDLVVIYLSSHGSPSSMDVAGANYIVAHNTDKDRLYATGIQIQEFARIIKERVHCDRVVVILDACHSGAAKTAEKGLVRRSNFDPDQVVQGSGQIVICSSAPDQSSWESKRYENGVFTHQLIDALKQSPKLSGAFDYLKDHVQTEVLQDRAELQTPAFKSKWTGADLVVSAAPTNPRPGMAEPPRIPRPAQPAATSPRTGVATAGAQRPATTVAIPPKPPAPPAVPVAKFGEYAGNGKVRLKMLDAQSKATGWYYDIEIQNQSPTTINPWYFAFELYKDGYTLGKFTGSGVSGSDKDLGNGAKAKLTISTGQEADMIVVKCNKPGWSDLKLLISDSAGDTATTSEQPAAAAAEAAYGEYAGNGKVLMKVLDTQQKMTGFYITIEVVNKTAAPFDSWAWVFDFFKDGYSLSRTSGSGVFNSDLTLKPGMKIKLDMSTVEVPDEVKVDFKKPGWTPVTLKLK